MCSQGVSDFKESAERPWDCGVSCGHTIAFLCETIKQGFIFGKLWYFKILPSSAASM